MANQPIEIDVWTSDHPRWGDLLACVEREGQQAWFEAQLPFHLGSYVLVALQDGEIAGFLRFVLQQIGPEARERGCYQVRSWSLLKYQANHHLKLKLGFCAQAEQRHNGYQGVYYLLPLKPVP